MAVSTIATFETVVKQGWTQNDMEVQFDKDDALLEAMEKRRPSQLLGLEALTEVWVGRGGGYTPVGKEGTSALNEAAPQQVARAKWEMKRHWYTVKIDTAAIKRTQGNNEAIVNLADLTVEGAMSDLRNQIGRQLWLDGTGLIAQCATTTSSNTIKLTVTGFYGLGYQAIRNGWLTVGQQIDIGTKAEPHVKANGVTITAVGGTESVPTITISGSAIEVGETHYVSIHNARAAEVSVEANGFRNIIGTGELGGLSTSTYPGWKANVDESGGAITREKVLGMKRKIAQNGFMPDWAFTSLKQLEALENQLYPQVRFASPNDINAGNGETMTFNGLKVQAHRHCPDGDFNLVKMDKVAVLRNDKPYWVTEEYQGTKIFDWTHGTTYLESAIEYFLEMYSNRRNLLGALRELA